MFPPFLKLPYLSPDFERFIEESDSDSETDAEFVTARNNESPLDIMKRESVTQLLRTYSNIAQCRH